MSIAALRACDTFPDPAPARPPDAAPRTGWSALRLEDFSAPAIRPPPAASEALARARAEGRAEGAAAAHDAQMAALTLALGDHAAALAAATAAHQAALAGTRAEIAALLRAITGALLPRGQDARLLNILLAELAATPADERARLSIDCPPALLPALTAACAEAGLPVPPHHPATTPAIRLDGEVMQIDLAAMQARLLTLIDDFYAGET